MSHRSLFWPLALIAVAAVTLAFILASIPSDPRALAISASIECPTTDPGYPSCSQTQVAETKTARAQAGSPTTDPAQIIQGCPTEGPNNRPPYPPYEECLKTRTALLQQTERSSWTSTPTSPPAQVQPSATRTPTATQTLTPTQGTAQAGETPTGGSEILTPSATRALPTPTIEDPEIAAAAITCTPGEAIIIEGSAAPGRALIVTFGDRPVGGGFSRSDGSYRIRLHIGAERPGLYPVLVEDRDTSDTIQELLCRVPALTPTPTPPLVP